MPRKEYGNVQDSTGCPMEDFLRRLDQMTVYGKGGNT